MSLQPSFTRDLAELPTHAFSYRSLTWWGIIGFMVIEGSAFALAIAAYFFLMSHEQEWAPRPWEPPT
jgi:cytochrome c oxidase subunit 3